MKRPKTDFDRAAPSGWMARLVRCSSSWERVNRWWFWIISIIGLGLVIYGNRLFNDSLQITITTVYFCSVYSYLGGLLTFELIVKPSGNHTAGNASDETNADVDHVVGAEIPPLDDRAETDGDSIGSALLEDECDRWESSGNGDHGSKNSSTNVKAHPPLGARESVERGVEVVVIINTGQQGGS